MTKATFKFIWSRNNYVRSDGRAPIYLQIILNRKIAFYNTKMLVLKKQFKNQFITGSLNDESFNSFIQGIREHAIAQEENFIRTGRDYTAQDIARATHTSEFKFVSFLGYFNFQLKESTELRQSTIRQYRVTLKHLKDYNKINGMHHITFANIQGFDRYMISIGLSNSSRRGHHKRANKMITQASNDKQFDGENPYNRFVKPTEDRSKIMYLTEQELEKIISFKTDEPELKGLEWVRDMFIIQCLTGLAYSDLHNLSFDNIFSDQESEWIRIDRQKTGVEQKILIFPKVMELIEKYNLPLPVRTNQKYNAYLKTLADLVGINKAVTSHVARHTFATYLLNKGASQESVAQALGHSTTKETKRYAKLLDTTLRDELKKASR